MNASLDMIAFCVHTLESKWIFDSDFECFSSFSGFRIKFFTVTLLRDRKWYTIQESIHSANIECGKAKSPVVESITKRFFSTFALRNISAHCSSCMSLFGLLWHIVCLVCGYLCLPYFIRNLVIVKLLTLKSSYIT